MLMIVEEEYDLITCS